VPDQPQHAGARQQRTMRRGVNTNRSGENRSMPVAHTCASSQVSVDEVGTERNDAGEV